MKERIWESLIQWLSIRKSLHRKSRGHPITRRLVNIVGIRVVLWHSKHRESQGSEFHGIYLGFHSNVIFRFYQDTLVHEHCTPHH